MNTGKTLNGLGGLINGTAGIALGVKAIKNGNKEQGGLLLTTGASNVITAMGPLAEVGTAKLWAGKSPAFRILNTARLFVFGGGASVVFNLIGFLGLFAGIGLVAAEEEKYMEKQEKYFGEFFPTLKNYGIDGLE